MRKDSPGATEASAASPSQIWLCRRIGRGAVRNTECLKERDKQRQKETDKERQRQREIQRDRQGKYFYICTQFIKM